ncbi:hypothetical protein PWT90_02033 [Aphanocladium album]|nr:hypothetical protein PWT90_02033 [Aphanocladium album]
MSASTIRGLTWCPVSVLGAEHWSRDKNGETPIRTARDHIVKRIKDALKDDGCESGEGGAGGSLSEEHREALRRYSDLAGNAVKLMDKCGLVFLQEGPFPSIVPYILNRRLREALFFDPSSNRQEPVPVPGYVGFLACHLCWAVIDKDDRTEHLVAEHDYCIICKQRFESLAQHLGGGQEDADQHGKGCADEASYMKKVLQYRASTHHIICCQCRRVNLCVDVRGNHVCTFCNEVMESSSSPPPPPPQRTAEQSRNQDPSVDAGAQIHDLVHIQTACSPRTSSSSTLDKWWWPHTLEPESAAVPAAGSRERLDDRLIAWLASVDETGAENGPYQEHVTMGILQGDLAVETGSRIAVDDDDSVGEMAAPPRQFNTMENLQRGPGQTRHAFAPRTATPPSIRSQLRRKDWWGKPVERLQWLRECERRQVVPGAGSILIENNGRLRSSTKAQVLGLLSFQS